MLSINHDQNGILSLCPTGIQKDLKHLCYTLIAWHLQLFTILAQKPRRTAVLANKPPLLMTPRGSWTLRKLDQSWLGSSPQTPRSNKRPSGWALSQHSSSTSKNVTISPQDSSPQVLTVLTHSKFKPARASPCCHQHTYPNWACDIAFAASFAKMDQAATRARYNKPGSKGASLAPPIKTTKRAKPRPQPLYKVRHKNRIDSLQPPYTHVPLIL